MAQASYSFLDVAVLNEVRERFAAGDALAILSVDLDEVIWANGPGAALFGHENVETILGAEAPLGTAAKRQIAATSGFPEIGRDRPLLVRVTTGVSSRALPMLASAITLPDGENAILVAQPAADQDAAKTMERALGGFTEAGHFVAFVDSTGAIEAASKGFERLGLNQDALARMVDGASAGQPIVKRMIAGRRGPLPTGLARLTDSRSLLVVIDEGFDAEGYDAAQESIAEAVTEDQPAVREVWYLGSDQVGQRDNDVAEAEPAEAAETPVVASAEAQPPAIAKDEAASPEATPDSPREVSEPKPVESGPTAAPAESPAFDRATNPVRFVWRTDAEGCFSQISPDFAKAVGKEAADIVGRRFRDVANAFALDPSGDIEGLLARRDTWSGRSVLWPVAGTDLKIPVDLAALPVYDRNRNFEGFRGFGVARGGDATVDPEGIGLVLVTRLAPAETDTAPVGDAKADANRKPAADQGSGAPVAETPADPFRGEKPALTVTDAPDRRSSDKIIRLAEHRPPAQERGHAGEKTLSTADRIAFQQIGERLKKESGAAYKDAENKAAGPEAKTPVDPVRPEAPGKPAEVEPPVSLQEEKSASASVEAAKGPVEQAVEDIRALEMLDGVTAEETTDTASSPEPEAPLRPRRAPRPGISLLDFAEWGKDEAKAAEEPAALVEMDEAAAAVELDTPPRPGDEPDAGEDVPLVSWEDAERPADEAEKSDHAAPGPEPAAAEGPLFAETDLEPVEPDEEAIEAAETEVDETAADSSHYHGDGLSILEKLPVPVLVHSGDRLHYANDEFFALTGYGSVEELAEAGGIGALFAESYEDGPDREDANRSSDKADRHMRLKTRDGKELPVEAFLQSVPWDGGKALLLVLSRAKEGAFADKSPLIAELEARVAEMRTIIDTATDGVVLISRDGSIRSISRPAEALFGMDSDEVVGKPFASLFAIESQKAVGDYLNGLTDHGVASVLNDGREVIGREAQGRFIPLFMTIGKLPGDSGYCAVVRDITQWKRAEEDLTQARATAERASSHKTEFLARVSHEIRTPLNAIIGFSELMLDEKFGPVANDRYRDYLRDINRSGNHVLDLVNDLLDISKIEAGQQEMAYEAVSLNEALAETVALMQPQANRERVIIRSSFASKLPDVVADVRSVRQIALNVLSNAVRYTQAGGQVIVSTAYEPNGEVVMRVRDTGIGMTPAEIDQAMKPFKQINALKRARGDGTGLGLPLTKAMVEANRAKFAIHSTPGEGTLVEVAFPSTRVLAD